MRWSNKRRTQRGKQGRGCTNQTSHGRGTGTPGAKHEPGREGQGHPGRIYEGFLKNSDPMAWGRVIRVLKCNTVYLTRY